MSQPQKPDYHFHSVLKQGGSGFRLAEKISGDRIGLRTVRPRAGAIQKHARHEGGSKWGAQHMDRGVMTGGRLTLLERFAVAVFAPGSTSVRDNHRGFARAY